MTRWLPSALLAVTACALIVVVCSTARAEDPTPTGVGWYCSTASNKYNARDKAGRCFRSEETCNAFQAQIAEADLLGSLITDCRAQKNAAALTYFDVMDEVTRFEAVPSTAMCNELRKSLVRNKDNQRVSACKLVGDRIPKPGTFNADAVPKGKDWYCTNRDKPSLDVCRRNEATCKELDDEACTKQVNAFALTWPRSSASEDAFLAETDTPGHGLGLFRSAADCKRFRDQVAGFSEGVSPCTPVTTVETAGAADRSLFPEGTGWFCYALAKVPQGWNRDICFRDESTCNQMREDVIKMKHDPRECAPAMKAYGFTSQKWFFAFPTKDQCDQVAAADEFASRCEPVGRK